FVLAGVDLDLLLVGVGDISGLKAFLGNLGLPLQIPRRLIIDEDIGLGQQRGHVGLGNALIQGALGIVKPGAGAQNCGAGPVLAVTAFAGDLDELADGGEG